MTKKKALIVSACCLIVLTGLAFFRGTPGNHGNSGNPDAQLFAGQALNVVKSLQSGDCRNAMKDFDGGLTWIASPTSPIYCGTDSNPRPRPRVAAEQLSVHWSDLIRARGQCREYFVTHAEDNYDDRSCIYTVYVTCKFERGTLYAVVKFGPQKKISDFRMWDKPQR